MLRSPSLLDAAIARQDDAFVGYVRQYVGPEEAEDVVQDALLRAVESAPSTDDEDALTRWLWRVVRNAAVDAHRRHTAAGRRESVWAAEQPQTEMPPEEAPRLCACYRPLLDELTPGSAELLRANLGGESAADMANRLGVSAGTLRVRRHRARAALRDRLEETCRTCSGCLDCTC